MAGCAAVAPSSGAAPSAPRSPSVAPSAASAAGSAPCHVTSAAAARAASRATAAAAASRSVAMPAAGRRTLTRSAAPTQWNCAHARPGLSSAGRSASPRRALRRARAPESACSSRKASRQANDAHACGSDAAARASAADAARKDGSPQKAYRPSTHRPPGSMRPTCAAAKARQGKAERRERTVGLGAAARLAGVLADPLLVDRQRRSSRSGRSARRLALLASRCGGLRRGRCGRLAIRPRRRHNGQREVARPHRQLANQQPQLRKSRSRQRRDARSRAQTARAATPPADCTASAHLVRQPALQQRVEVRRQLRLLHEHGPRRHRATTGDARRQRQAQGREAALRTHATLRSVNQLGARRCSGRGAPPKLLVLHPVGRARPARLCQTRVSARSSVRASAPRRSTQSR